MQKLNNVTVNKLTELFNERIDIVNSFDNKADKVYLDGMLSVLNALGYELANDLQNGNVTIIPR